MSWPIISFNVNLSYILNYEINIFRRVAVFDTAKI